MIRSTPNIPVYARTVARHMHLDLGRKYPLAVVHVTQWWTDAIHTSHYYYTVQVRV